MAYTNPNDPRGRKSRREHYYRNRQRYIDNSRVLRRAIEEVVRTAKDEPCKDCNQRFHYCVMDFDHLDSSEKLDAVGILMRKGNLGKVVAEMKKCDVVCANCHRMRTWNRLRASSAGADVGLQNQQLEFESLLACQV